MIPEERLLNRYQSTLIKKSYQNDKRVERVEILEPKGDILNWYIWMIRES